MRKEQQQSIELLEQFFRENSEEFIQNKLGEIDKIEVEGPSCNEYFQILEGSLVFPEVEEKVDLQVWNLSSCFYEEMEALFTSNLNCIQQSTEWLEYPSETVKVEEKDINLFNYSSKVRASSFTDKDDEPLTTAA